jgi:hypothetical protein
MNQQESNRQEVHSHSRPALLTLLCVMSFIGSGLMGLSFLMVYLSYGEAIPMILELGDVFPGMELLATAGKGFFLTGFILYLLSFAGVNLMWRMKKAGFHFYTASQIMALLLPVIYIKSFPFQISEAILSLLFIFFYSGFLKKMVK